MSPANCAAIYIDRPRNWAASGPGDIEGYRANLPFTWGAQPHNGLIYFNDINSGLWIVKIGDKVEKDRRPRRESELEARC